jgi:hypothetical protein
MKPGIDSDLIGKTLGTYQDREASHHFCLLYSCKDRREGLLDDVLLKNHFLTP